jgi:transcriptional regulator
MAKLTADQVRQVRKMKKQKIMQKVIAEKMKMSTAAVSFLLNKKTYRGVK